MGSPPAPRDLLGHQIHERQIDAALAQIDELVAPALGQDAAEVDRIEDAEIHEDLAHELTAGPLVFEGDVELFGRDEAARDHHFADAWHAARSIEPQRLGRRCTLARVKSPGHGASSVIAEEVCRHLSFGTQREAAADAVAGLVGVRRIKNEIDIVNDADPVDVTLNVQDALLRYSLIPDDSDVLVETDANTVTLVGHVETWAEHDAVIVAAWMTPGVFDVFDELLVTG